MGAEGVAATAQFSRALPSFKGNGGLQLCKGAQDFANNPFPYAGSDPQPGVGKEMLHL